MGEMRLERKTKEKEENKEQQRSPGSRVLVHTQVRLCPSDESFSRLSAGTYAHEASDGSNS